MNNSYIVDVDVDVDVDNQNYRNFLFDDYDSQSEDSGHDSGDESLDTRWITEYETQLMHDEYRLFLKTDVISVTFDFYYLDHHKSYVERIVPMKYSLKIPNQITQNELFSIVQSYQHVDKKYYNFHTLLFYSFDFQNINGINGSDIIRGLSEYLQYDPPTLSTNNFIEYSNLLSIDTIYLTPVLAMFHDVIGFSVLLYED
jgi:hypothetical protein